MTSPTALLGLALPVQGDLSGTWGDTVNDSITSLLDSAVAGVTTLSADTDVALSSTDYVANQARQAIIRWTASNGANTRNVTAPAKSKTYVVINAGTGSIVFRGAGPTAGVTIVSGEKCVVAWSDNDFVKVASSTSNGTVTSVAQSFTGGLISVAGSPVTTSGTLALTVAGTSGGIPYFSSSSAWASSSALTANALMVGGGAGAAPSTVTTGTGVVTALGVNTGSSGAFVVNGGALGTPSGGTLTSCSGLPLSTGVTGLLPVANGGTGTATPAIVAGTNVTVSGSWPNQTINASSTAQVYPGAGIANSTGSAWGTSYTTTGTGTVVALATSPTFVTPALGTPSQGVLSSCTVDGTNAVGFRSIPPVGTKTGSYTLATGDVGKYVQVGSGGSITIPDATFSEGNAISVFNNTSGNITITCTITTAYIAGTDSDKSSVTLATRGVATILFISGTVCVISGNVS
jgi:hypothetical protein